jgi:PAS domain S-box-containing protein
MDVKVRSGDSIPPPEEQFRLLVQGVTDYAIYMLSPAGIVTSWNAGAERIKGCCQSEIVGQDFSCFYAEEDRVGGLPALTLARAAEEGYVEDEGWRMREDGSRFWTHAVVYAICNSAANWSASRRSPATLLNAKRQLPRWKGQALRSSRRRRWTLSDRLTGASRTISTIC